MPLSATNEFINVCKKADKALHEVDDLYNIYQDFLDKRELRKNSKVMEFLSLYQYDIYKEVFDPLYGGKPKKYTKRRRPKRQNKTRSKR